MCWNPGASNAAKILLHGRNPDPDFRDDGALMEHLELIFGADNVDYMAGIAAASDGSSAIGYDAVIISSSLASNDIRGKYEDSRAGIFNMENAVVDTGVGEFQMSSASGTTGDVHDKVRIVNPGHPLAAGLSGTVNAFNNTHSMQIGKGTLAPGAVVIATQAPGNPEGTEDPTIFAVDTGGALLGDGSDGMPAIAPGRRLMFFVSDPGFADLTPDGLKLFDAAANWVAVPDPGTFALCAIGLLPLLGRRPRRGN
jgi:hypothetical protein